MTEEKETDIPLQALDAIKCEPSIHPPSHPSRSDVHQTAFITTTLPSLTPLGISSTKLCWYTDSVDNSFLITPLPSQPSIVVCSGGSGHGFKFLPILGREVVKILEGDKGPNVYRDMWKWRETDFGKRNGLEEGEDGPRVMAKQTMASSADWSF